MTWHATDMYVGELKRPAKGLHSHVQRAHGVTAVRVQSHHVAMLQLPLVRSQLADSATTHRRDRIRAEPANVSLEENQQTIANDMRRKAAFVNTISSGSDEIFPGRRNTESTDADILQIGL